MDKDLNELDFWGWALEEDKWRDMAMERRNRRSESQDRSDTDGFMSQWAMGVMSDLYLAKAEICKNKGMADFIGLYDGDRRVKAKIIHGKYGPSWLLHEDEEFLIEARGKPFLPTGANSRILSDLGLKERDELAPAWAKLESRGTGLSGTTWVATFRRNDQWGQDATLVSETETL